MDLTPERWARISALLGELLELSPEQRGAHLERASAGDAELRAAVEALLAAEQEAGEFLKEGAAVETRLLLQEWIREEEGPDALIGQEIGSWRLVSRLGQGGMGVVYLAERIGVEFRQAAALKLIKRGLDTEVILERFRRERRILARLEHPGIARLLDGGAAPDGRPFIVMEHVEGEAITRFCDARRLSVEERLRLFLDACDAVEYAHRRLVIHRDIKPPNILVTADARVRLLDFGIARVMGEDEEEGARLTRTGDRPMTPEYASPEQIRGEPATTATDVYALGLTLYELLVGRRPYRATGGARSEIEKAVLESPPVSPVRALDRDLPAGATGEAAGPTTSELAQNRATTPERLRRRLRGDLETIILMALRKEPDRRYSGPGLLAADLRRHLKGLPVLARKDIWVYRAGKFVSRHRVAVATTTFVFLSLLAGLAGVAWESRVARLEAKKAEVVKNFLISVFGRAAPSQSLGEKITARELLDRGSRRIDAELAGQPEVQAELLGVVGSLYGELGLYAKGEPLLKRAMEMERAIRGRGDPAVAEATQRWGVALWEEGNYQKAARVEEEALALSRRVLRPEDPKLAESLSGLAVVYHDLGQPEKALSLHREALKIDTAAFGRDSATTATDLMNAGDCLANLKRYDEAEPLLREALAIRRKILPADHPDVATAQHTLAALLSSRGDYPEAEKLYREALGIRKKVLGPDHPDVALTLSNLETLLEARGDYAGAVPIAREALEIRRRELGPEHPDLATSLNNYATLCYRTEHYDEAERALRQALKIWRKQLGPDHTYVASARNNLGMVLREEGKLDEAETEVRAGLALRRRANGEESQEVAQSLRALGLVELQERRLPVSDGDLSRSLALSRKVYPAGHPRVAEVLLALGRLRTLQGRPGEAEPLLREALATYMDKTGEDSPQTAEAKMLLGAALAALGRASEAAPLLEDGLEIRSKRLGEKSWQTAEARYHLAICLALQGKKSQAKSLLEASIASLTAKRGEDDPLTGAARDALRRLH